MADGSPIEVSGGAGSIEAHFDDMTTTGGFLADLGVDLVDAGQEAGLKALSGDLAQALVLCPGQVARVEGALTTAAALAGGTGVAMKEIGEFLEEAVVILRAADEGLDALLEFGQDVAGFAFGMALPGLVLLGGVAILSNPALMAYLIAHQDELPAQLQQALYDNPWLQEALTRMAPGMVQGLTTSLAALLGPAGLPLPTLLSGGHWPTADYEGSIEGLIAAGGLFGLFGDTGPLTVESEGDPTRMTFREETFLQQINATESLLYDHYGPNGAKLPDDVNPESRVRVVTLDNGNLIVQIPGTEAWGATRGTNPSDTTSNVHMMSGAEQTQMMTAVTRAIDDARARGEVPAGAQVMLTGHSQGGITAAALASNPAIRDRYNISSVVTSGSPIGRFDIPDSVSVMSLEHDQDVVPRLDGQDNPARDNWVTVSRDLTEGDAPMAGHDLTSSHDVARNYAQTGAYVDRSDDASVQSWRDRNRQFTGSGSSTVYAVEGPRP